MADQSLPILVINLTRRPDRRAHMEAIAKGARVGLTFVPAVDAADPGAEVSLGPDIGLITGRPRSRMDYACTSSHRMCWKRLIDEEIPMAIVLEDDVLLADDFDHLTDTRWVPVDADIVKLETDNNAVRVRDRTWNPSIRRHVGRLAGPHLGAAGYLISRAAATRLWHETVVPADIIDHILFGKDVGVSSAPVIYQLDPAPVIQGMYHVSHAETGWASSTIEEDRLARGFTYAKRKSLGTAGPRPPICRGLSGKAKRFWAETIKRRSHCPVLFG